MKIYDLHCDSILNLCDGKPLISNINFSAKYPQFQFFAVFVDNIALDSMRENAISRIDSFKNNFDGVIVTDKATFEASKSSNRSALISLEGASFVDSVKLLDFLYEKGVRSFCPAWNNVSRICATNLESGKPSDFGLTLFGKEIIKRAFELDMILDVSHLSDNGFFDLCEISSKPFIASHSNARKICRHPRNLTDFQIKEIVSRGGIIGLNIFPPFVSDTDSFSDLLRQIEHFLSLGAENNLAFGFDIDGTDGMYFNEIPKFVSIHDYIYDCLLKFYPEKIIDAIAFGNAEKFLSAHFGRKATK